MLVRLRSHGPIALDTGTPADSADHALDQRVRRAGDGGERLEDLQRLAAVRIVFLPRGPDARRLACRRAAMALRRHVAAGPERACVCRLWSLIRTLSPQAAAHLAARGDRRRS